MFREEPHEMVFEHSSRSRISVQKGYETQCIMLSVEAKNDLSNKILMLVSKGVYLGVGFKYVFSPRKLGK